MRNSARRSIVLLCAFVFCAGVIALAQDDTKKTIKKVPITQTSVTSGVEMFDPIAWFHGKDGGRARARPLLSSRRLRPT